jgi:hypothetical protein
MPYLDIEDIEQLQHLIQLYLAAHPEHRAMQRQLRAETGIRDEYFLSEALGADMAHWARSRALITKASWTRLLDMVHGLARRPEDVLPLTPRLLGGQLQPTVLTTEIQCWITLQQPMLAPGEEVLALTIPAAIQLLQSLATDPDASEREQARAGQLVAWLEGQVHD